MFLCLLPAGAFRSQICDANLAIFHHGISSACNSTSVEAKVWIHIQSLKRQLQLLSKCSIK